MQNLEQIRARNALKFLEDHPLRRSGNDNSGESSDGDVLSGFPALVINNGLLATVAFSMAKQKNYEKICGAIAIHLKDIGLLPDGVGLVTYLSNNDSTQLRLCTAEALAYLSYLKRFGKE